MQLRITKEPYERIFAEAMYCFIFVSFLFLMSCNEQSITIENNMYTLNKNLLKHVFIPKQIEWDTLNFLPESDMLVIHKNFPIFYFDNDSMVYLFEGLNELENDSILCCIENTRLIGGKYFRDYQQKNHLIIKLNDSKKNIIIDSHGETIVTINNFLTLDTITFINEKQFLYKEDTFFYYDRFMDESFVRIHDIIKQKTKKSNQISFSCTQVKKRKTVLKLEMW